MIKLNSNWNTQEDLFEIFIKYAQEIRAVAQQLKIDVKILSHLGISAFKKLGQLDQIAVIERLKMNLDIFKLAAEETIEKEIREEDNAVEEKKLLWFALQRLRLLPTSGLLDLIDDGDLVEVYVGTRQVYRTFNYYNICGYSLDELESEPWENLFSRETGYTQGILDEVAVCIKERRIVSSQVPPHFVFEISSEFQSKFEYQLKYVVPLKDLESHRPDCFLVVIKATRVEGDGTRASRKAVYATF